MADKFCDVCGVLINKDRVAFLPDTRHCVNCADAHGPKVVHDPDVLCAKPSLSCQNGFAPKD